MSGGKSLYSVKGKFSKPSFRVTPRVHCLGALQYLNYYTMVRTRSNRKRRGARRFLRMLSDMSNTSSLVDEVIKERKQHKNSRLHRVDWDFHVLSLKHGEFERRYRMPFRKFNWLLRQLEKESDFFRPCNRKAAQRHRRFYGCDPVDVRHKLAVALRWLAGGSYLDSRLVHGMTTCMMYNCVWAAVDAINASEKLQVDPDIYICKQ